MLTEKKNSARLIYICHVVYRVCTTLKTKALKWQRRVMIILVVRSRVPLKTKQNNNLAYNVGFHVRRTCFNLRAKDILQII